ncbi:MAG TPA: DUF456 domain-containing protein [Chitinophagales bacterium]|nr:DUF456 domain-containing protein [Chitinophagales bacterium]
MEAVDYVLIFSSLILCGLGIAGCVAPALPGPPLTYGAILVYHFGKGDVFSLTFLIIALLFVIAAIVIDYILPVYATKKFGGTRQGVWGGIIGLAAGLFFTPWGIIIGPLLGAIIGDLVAGKQFESALKSGIGSFVGFLLATAAKLSVSITLTVILIVRMIQVHVF